MSITGKEFVSAATPDSAQNALQTPVSEAELKRAENRTILLPQPSNDPRDPLVRSYPSRLIRLGLLLTYSSTELASIQEDRYPWCFVLDQFCGLRLAGRRPSCIDSSG